MISPGSVGTTVSRIKVKNNYVNPLLERGRGLIFLKLQMLFVMFPRKQDQNITAVSTSASGVRLYCYNTFT